MCLYHRISVRNKQKVGQKVEQGAEIYVTDSLFGSNQFNDDNIKVLRNCDHDDTAI